MYDCGFTKENHRFRYRAAAIIVENNCVLLATTQNVDYFYSIGGAVKIGETSEDQLNGKFLKRLELITKLNAW